MQHGKLYLLSNTEHKLKNPIITCYEGADAEIKKPYRVNKDFSIVDSLYIFFKCTYQNKEENGKRMPGKSLLTF